MRPLHRCARLMRPSTPRVRRCRGVCADAADPGRRRAGSATWPTSCWPTRGAVIRSRCSAPRPRRWSGSPTATAGRPARVHAGLLVGALGLLGAALQRPAARSAAVGRGDRGGDLGRAGRNVAGAHRPDDGASCWTAATSTAPDGCCRRCAGATRRRWTRAGLTRAALESVAENTSDAQVAPLLWAAVGGVPGVLVYRARQHPGRDDRPPLAALRPIRLGRSTIGRRGQLRRRPGDRGAGGGLRARRSGVAAGRGAGVAPRRRPASQPQRRGRRGGVRRCAGRAARRARRSTATSCRSGRRSATGRPPTVADLRRAVRLSRAVQAGRGGAGGRRSSAPPAVAVGEFLLGGERRAARSGGSRGAVWPSRAARPDLGVDEVAQRRSARRCRTRSTGCRRTGTGPASRWGSADHAEPAGLIVDQLQVGPGQRDAGQRRRPARC